MSVALMAMEVHHVQTVFDCICVAIPVLSLFGDTSQLQASLAPIHHLKRRVQQKLREQQVTPAARKARKSNGTG